MPQTLNYLTGVSVLFTESRWELPASSSSSQVDVTPADIKTDHTDRPPAAKKKKTAQQPDVSKVVQRLIDLPFKGREAVSVEWSEN